MTAILGMQLKTCVLLTRIGNLVGLMKRLIFAALLAALPAVAFAGGANTKTGIGDKNGPECAPGQYFDSADGLCLTANWI